MLIFSCNAVKLNFSKAFDRVVTRLLIKILRGLNLDEFSVRAIETLDLDSKAAIKLVFFSQPASKFIAV